MLRVIRELRPTWVLGENVPGIVNLALDTVLSDLEEEGYAVQCFRIPACGVDAPHKRERIAIVAYSLDRGGSLRRNGELQDASEDGGEGLDNRAGETAALSGERRQDESGTAGMADGLRAGVHEADPDAHGNGLQGRMLDEVLDTASTHTHTHTHTHGRGYDGLLRSFLEVTPLGKIGPMNPEFLEYLMGYPIGWTELSASETR